MTNADIRLLDNEHLLDLFPLMFAMCKEIDTNSTVFGAVKTLIDDIDNKKDFIVVGLFEKDKLVGFVTGYLLTRKMFYFSGIYVTMKGNKNLKYLVEYCFNLVKEKNYSSWCVDATNKNISSIMEKYGAKPKFIRYEKELTDGKDC